MLVVVAFSALFVAYLWFWREKRVKPQMRVRLGNIEEMNTAKPQGVEYCFELRDPYFSVLIQGNMREIIHLQVGQCGNQVRYRLLRYEV